MSGPRRKDKTTAKDVFPSTVLVERLYVTTKEEAIRQLLNTLCIEGVLDISREEEVLKSMLEREKVASTGIGCGIAIPHAKNKFADRLGVAVGIHEEGIEFGSHDKEAVRVVFCWVCPPTETKKHLAMMRTISSIARDPEERDKLLNVRDRRTLLAALDTIPT